MMLERIELGNQDRLENHSGQWSRITSLGTFQIDDAQALNAILYQLGLLSDAARRMRPAVVPVDDFAGRIAELEGDIKKHNERLWELERQIRVICTTSEPF
jgi:hypothetical protein